MGRFKKLAAAVVGAAALALYGFMDDQALSNVEVVQTVSAAVAAFLVWLQAEGPVGVLWKHAKAVAYGATALLAVLVTTLPEGITQREWLALLIAFATGAGVLTLKNEREPSAGYVTTH